MKRILLATTLIMAFGLSAIAQSKFNSGNTAATAVTFREGPQDGQKVVSFGLPTKYWAQMYVTPAGGDEGSLAPIATAIGGIGIGPVPALAGLYQFSNITVAGLAPDSQVLVQIRGWLGNNTSGGYATADIRGTSVPVAMITKASPIPNVVVPAWQIVVPEPGSMMLAGLGLSSLLFLRRRK